MCGVCRARISERQTKRRLGCDRLDSVRSRYGSWDAPGHDRLVALCWQHVHHDHSDRLGFDLPLGRSLMRLSSGAKNQRVMDILLALNLLAALGLGMRFATL